MTITRNVTMTDGTHVQIEIKLTADEIRTAHWEQRKKNYYEDVMMFLERMKANVSADCIWEEMFEYDFINHDDDFSYWDNMREAYEYVMSMSGC